MADSWTLRPAVRFEVDNTVGVTEGTGKAVGALDTLTAGKAVGALDTLTTGKAVGALDTLTAGKDTEVLNRVGLSVGNNVGDVVQEASFEPDEWEEMGSGVGLGL